MALLQTPQLANFRVPAIENEPSVSRTSLLCLSDAGCPCTTRDECFVSYALLHRQKTYAPNSAEREQLLDALAALRKNSPYEVPCFVNGEKVLALILSIV